MNQHNPTIAPKLPTRRIVVLILLAAAIACSGQLTPDDLPLECRTCTVDADCTYYQGQCCDHCNGGEAFAVRQDCKARAERDYKESSCDMPCTLMACADPTARCSDGKCALAP